MSLVAKLEGAPQKEEAKQDELRKVERKEKLEKIKKMGLKSVK